MSFFSSGRNDRSKSSRISDPPSFNPSYSREPVFGSSNRLSLNNPTSAINDSRNLHRRFTTSYSTLAQQRRSAFDTPAADIFAFQPTPSPAEKKKQEYEQLRQKRMERQRRLDMLNQESHREELELARLSQELGIDSNTLGHQSEPTTPPEYRDTGFPTSLSRPNRFSAGNLISPSGLLGKHNSKNEANMTSPPTERARAYNALTAAAPSVPQSKNNSDEEDNQDEVLDFNHRSAASFNRNSMPVTRRDLGTNGDQLGHVNTHRFLFGDEEKNEQLSSTPRPKSFFHQQTDKDDFPVLVKRDMAGNVQYSTGSSAFDMSSAEDSDVASSSQASKRSSLHRSYQNGNGNTMNGFGFPSGAQPKTGDSPPYSFNSQATPQVDSFSSSNKTHQTSSNRHSFGAGTTLSSGPKRPGLASPSTMSEGSSTPKLQQSYSTNDIPTVKTVGNGQYQGAPPQYSNASAEQRLHSHNFSLGRIPPQGMNPAFNSNRHSRDLSSASAPTHGEDSTGLQSLDAVLQSGMHAPQQSGSQGSNTTPPTASDLSPFSGQSQASSNRFPQQTFSPNYGGSDQSAQSAATSQMSGLSNAINGLNLGGMGNPQQFNMNAHQWNNAAQPYTPGAFHGYGSYQSYNNTTNGRYSDPPSSRSSRRGTGTDDASRMGSARLDMSIVDLREHTMRLCVDQNGCRFLQKQLEDRDSENATVIFEETKDNMFTLMTDPFGNYLVQKLLECTTVEQHTYLISNASSNMVRIALNQHGTRALQKMIEYVVEPHQIQILIDALREQVVPMIQDLNGNHVIQKCLNRLSAPNIQFIIDAVSQNCIVVGTHRHGCCVIQRCIDHATPEQKAQLVSAITQCSLPLVQDPFGNYVLQYIFDQGEESFSQLLCRTFLGRIPELSKQKFSSNVIEKCIRIADDDVKHQMITELINFPNFDTVVDDSYANYVVQTAWDNANDEDEALLCEKIRPIVTRIRHKPYGRRFMSRINERDKRLGYGSAAGSSVGSPEPSMLGMNRLGLTPTNHGMFGTQQNGAFQQHAFGQNGFGQGGFGQNNFGQNAFGQNGFGQTAYGQTGFGQNAFNQNGFGQNAFNIGSPQFGHSQMSATSNFSSSRPDSRHTNANNFSQTPFSPTSQYGAFSPPPQQFPSFGQSFGQNFGQNNYGQQSYGNGFGRSSGY